MYWVLDAIFVLLVLIAIICGYKRGGVNMLFTTLGVLLLFALAIAGGAGFLLLFYKLGVVDNFAYTLIAVLGETNSLFTLLNMTSFDVCQILSAVIFLIIGLIISAVICSALSKLLKRFYDFLGTKARRGFYGVFAGVLGVIIYLALVVGIFLGVFALIANFSAQGKEFWVCIEEFIRSCTICGWLYEINPLAGLIG